MSWVNKLLSIALLTFFIGTMFFSLFHMSMGMDMSGGMTDCPFMAHEEFICPMNLADHISAWKSVFLSTVPSITLLLAVAGAVAFIVPRLLVPKRRPVLMLRKQLRERTYTFSYRPLQELFSNGILHPKLY